MPMPFASPLRLTDDERQGLQSLARAHSTPQALAFRCRLILRVAAPEAPTNRRVAADLHCHRYYKRLTSTQGRLRLGDPLRSVAFVRHAMRTDGPSWSLSARAPKYRPIATEATMDSAQLLLPETAREGGYACFSVASRAREHSNQRDADGHARSPRGPASSLNARYRTVRAVKTRERDSSSRLCSQRRTLRPSAF